MDELLSVDQLTQAGGTPVLSSDGKQIGAVEEIFVDEATGKPEWVGVGAGLFKTKRVLVPVKGARLDQSGFRVPYTQDQVKNTPAITDDEISQETERELYSHYGLDYSESRSESGLPEGGPTVASGGTAVEADATVTRSEEELRIGKRTVEAGKVRLRKWVETVPVDQEVEVRRETARIERQPINQPVEGVELSEERFEVPLKEEQLVVEKQTVAKERISVDKDVRTQRQTIQEELRRERVEIEGDEIQPDTPTGG